MYYRNHIDLVIDKITQHLNNRGTNQKMAFYSYYKSLNYQWPLEDKSNDNNSNQYIKDIYTKNSVIKQYKEYNKLELIEQYFITHEIMFLYKMNLIDSLLNTKDYKYLYTIIPKLVNRSIITNNTDILAEYIMIMDYLRMHNTPSYLQALNHIINAINDNGSYGHYENYQQDYNEKGLQYNVTYQAYLHNTEVVILALNHAILFH